MDKLQQTIDTITALGDSTAADWFDRAKALSAICDALRAYFTQPDAAWDDRLGAALDAAQNKLLKGTS